MFIFLFNFSKLYNTQETIHFIFLLYNKSENLFVLKIYYIYYLF